MKYFEKSFEKLSISIRNFFKKLIQGFKNYFNKLLFPLYLFPIKLLTYSSYYLVKFLIKFIIAFIGLIIEWITFPFKSFKNFLKSIFIITVSLYLIASLFVIVDYLNKQYGRWGKFLCSFGVQDTLRNSVVRIVGGYSEGSGFFISDNEVITNFHVIAYEPSPKIIFPDGKMITPVRITGSKDDDLAVLFTEDKYPDKVLKIADQIVLQEQEPLIASGYPLGTDLTGKATVVKGNFVDFRSSKGVFTSFIQTSINLVAGMSGGPLTDQCGNVVGINTIGLSGLSLFIDIKDAKLLTYSFDDQEITKIKVDASISPEEAVKAFYTYLKARRMEDGFNLLSEEYLQKTNFEEWTNRFTDILDVTIIKSEQYENSKDTAFVKFWTKNWVDGEAEYHYYEGTWQTVKEDGIYKMLKSKIKEVSNPDWLWFYE
ncbi:MAG: trypsin-like peptidase domain-containing protein [Patescibacteria group bacterium]